MCSRHHKQHDCHCGEAGSNSKERNNKEYSVGPRSPRQSNISSLSEISAPILVYKRRKHHGVCVVHALTGYPVSTIRSREDSLSVISDAPSVAVEKQHIVSPCDREIEAVEAPLVPISVCYKDPHALRKESTYGSSLVEDLEYDEFPEKVRQKTNEVDSINDSCSSSRTNVELVSASTKTEMDDTCECSSSTAILEQAIANELSEKDVCISILTKEGVLGRFQSRENHFSEEFGANSVPSSTRLCKICSNTTTSLKMLICDNCEEAFHLSCCHLRVKKVLVDEWFCHSCQKRKPTSLKGSSSRNSPNIIGRRGRNRSALSSTDLGPIALMLRDTKPYTIDVRVGKGFQADVPDWSGPVKKDCDTTGEPSELHPLDFVTSHDLNSTKPCRLGSMSNWLQCREILDVPGGNGAICGKWRRAPPSEVQTDDWECFRAFLWDPVHADCAVPQEMETEEILNQVKHINMVRPRFAAKQRKLELAAKQHKLNHTGRLDLLLANVKDIKYVYVRKRIRTK